jgi:hypothetical protein
MSGYHFLRVFTRQSAIHTIPFLIWSFVSLTSGVHPEIDLIKVQFKDIYCVKTVRIHLLNRKNCKIFSDYICCRSLVMHTQYFLTEPNFNKMVAEAKTLISNVKPITYRPSDFVRKILNWSWLANFVGKTAFKS